jgi:hypothetical protein
MIGAYIVLIQYEFNNFDRSELDVAYGVSLETEMVQHAWKTIQRYRDEHNLDLTDAHINAYVVLQYQQQKHQDKIRIKIKYSSTELRKMVSELPGFAEVALGILI